MRKFFLFAVGLAVALSSCIDDDHSLTYNESIERDEKIIQEYFIKNNITDTIADESGVYIQHVAEGTGDSPGESSTVRLTYAMYSLPDNSLVGEVTEPTVFGLSTAIEGLKVGLSYVQDGGEADLYIPCRYAFYGSNSTLNESVLRIRVTLKDHTVTMAEMDDRIIQEYFAEHDITDVVKDDSGVYIQHITEGTGDSPTLSDDITVEYELYNLPSDEEVPQTEDPVTFTLSNLIEGWQIGIPYMKEGGEAYIYIPREYAYNEGVLKFKIKLVSIE